MQIRHSYSIGSIVPFSSSTTFTTTDKNKDSSECTHILQAWPTFPDLQVQFSESHWNVEIFSIWGFSNKTLLNCARSGWTAAFARCTHGVPLSIAAGHSSFCFTQFCNDRNHSSLILKGSPTSNTLTAVKFQPLACTGALREWTTGYRLLFFLQCSWETSRAQRCFVVTNPEAVCPPVSPL